MKNAPKFYYFVNGMDAKRVLGYLGAAILLLLGIIFLMASAYVSSRIYVGLGLIVVSIMLLYYLRRPTKVEIIERHEVDLPGKVTVEPVKCPHCSAALDLTALKVKHGVPSINCPYCGKTFEVSEEPKW